MFLAHLVSVGVIKGQFYQSSSVLYDSPYHFAIHQWQWAHRPMCLVANALSAVALEVAYFRCIAVSDGIVSQYEREDRNKSNSDCCYY